MKVVFRLMSAVPGVSGDLLRQRPTQRRQFLRYFRIIHCPPASRIFPSSFWLFPSDQRCVFVSTELYEYRGCCGKSAHPGQRVFSWGCKYAERYAADFYISDFQSGLRGVVKAGYGAKVAAFVKPKQALEITKDNKDVSSTSLRWLADRNFSSNDRIMRLEEGCIKEGCTVSVMEIVWKHENVLMIVPPEEPTSTGCQWFRFLLPTYVEGLVLTCDDNQNADVIPV